MSANIHYEVFHKSNKKAGWLLDTACEERAQALEKAKELRARSAACSVRVSKESYDESNEVFHSVSIFSKGPEQHQRKLRENNRMDPPCASPLDLYTLHARRTLGRALGPWLKRQSVSIIELLHRPDLAESLAAAGFDRQHAIQKVAIAQAGAQECSVQHVVRRLTELADKATDRLRKLAKARSLPVFEKRGYAATFAKASKHKEPGFAMRHALADAMIGMKTWEKKFSFLCACVSDALVEGGGCQNSISMLDEFISETASLPHALDDLCVGSGLGERLDQITDVLTGKEQEAQKPGAGLLAKAISSGKLPITQSVLVARLFRDLCGPRRLFPEDFQREVELNRSLAFRLTLVDQSLAPADRLAEAFATRSARLLESEAIEHLLRSCKKNSADELLRLMQFEESIIGDHNKAKLATYIRAVIGAHKTRTWFSNGPGQPLERISRIGHAQRMVHASGFYASDKAELAALLDRLCCDVLDDTNILSQLEKRADSPLQGVLSIMKLAENGMLTIGECSSRICRRALVVVKTNAVREQIASGDPKTIANTRQIGRMVETLRARTDTG